MQISSLFRAGLVALLAMAGASVSSAAYADSGTIRVSVLKGGWVSGVDWGLVFGASQTYLSGTVRNIRGPSDVAGVYAAGGAGATIGSGVRAIVLTNQKGAVLELSGRQSGLMVNADLSGLAISLR